MRNRLGDIINSSCVGILYSHIPDTEPSQLYILAKSLASLCLSRNSFPCLVWSAFEYRCCKFLTGRLSCSSEFSPAFGVRLMLASTSFAADSIWNFMTRYGSINSCAIFGDVVLQIGVFKSSIFSRYFAEEGNCFMTWVLVSRTLAVKAAQATDLMFPKPIHNILSSLGVSL